MGMRNKDKTWPRPDVIRHVWIKSERKFYPPEQGFVLEWRRHSYHWTALVLYVPEPGRYVQEWIPRERLAPVKSEPALHFPDDLG